MNHADHVALLREGVPGAGGAWADLGSGAGAFTLALADLLGPGSVIYSIDRDASALHAQERAMRAQFPALTIHYLAADYTGPLDLPPLDGLVAANTLHFHRDKQAVVRRLRGYLRPGGRMIVVEYNVSRGNFAVPFALPLADWQRLAAGAGFEHTEALAARPSRFQREINSAVSW